MIRVAPGGAVDLSGLRDPYTGQPIPIFDPAAYNATWISQPFPGNAIPAERVSPAGLQILTKLFPRPNTAGVLNGWFSNLQVGQRYSYASDTGDARIDHIFNAANRVGVTFDVVAFNSLTGDPFAGMIPIPGGGGADSADATHSLNQSAAISYVRVIDATHLNELRAANVRVSLAQNDLLNGTGLARQFGIANANIDGFPQTSGFPQIQLSSGAITGGSTYKPLTFLDENAQIGDTFSWTPARHTVRLGYEFRRLESHPDFSLFPAGYQYYNGPYSSMTSDPSYSFYNPQAYYGNGGSDVADLLLGLPGWVEQGLQLTQPATHSYEQHGFAQDAWQIGRRVVVTCGIRYEYQAPYTAAGNLAANFDAATLRMLLAGRGGNSNALIQADKTNIAPRAGVAWRVASNTVLRAGWGIFYTPENDARSDVLTKNYPFFTQQVYENYPGNPIAYVLDSGQPRPTLIALPAAGGAIAMASVGGAANQSVYAIDPAFRTGYAQAGNLTVQHEFARGLTLETGYAGALARDLPYAIGNLNRGNALSPLLGPVQAQVSRGASQYHALESKLEKRFSRSLGFLVSYTYSKNMDNGPAPFNLGQNHQQPQDPRALALEHALSSTDLRHNLAASFVWRLPFARSASGWRRPAFAGWQFNGVLSAHSGLPVNVVRNGATPNYQGLRPNLIGDPNLPAGRRTLDRYFNTAAFSAQGLGATQIGNAGRNLVCGPGLADADLSLIKEAAVSERGRLEIRIESFNAANRPDFAAPNADMSQGTFGQITNTIGVPRIMQFAVKYKF